MKPVQTKFGQALQLAETLQQVAGLQVQVEKLKGDIKELRDKDRVIFDDQDKEIAALKELVKNWRSWAVLNFVVETSAYVSDTPWRKRWRELDAQTQAILAEQEQ